MMKYPVLCACANSGGFNLNSHGSLGRRLIYVNYKTTTLLDKIEGKLIRPPSCKIEDRDVIMCNGAFWLFRVAFLLLIFEPTGI